jgi:formate--tetrahydrofolate ligase
MICGDIMTMPGLPANPAACSIDLDAKGNVVGMF